MESDWAALEAIAMLLGMGIALASLGAWLWAMIDASVRPGEAWARAGQSKPLWLVVIVATGLFGCLAFGWIGALLYALIPRRAIKRSAGFARSY